MAYPKLPILPSTICRHSVPNILPALCTSYRHNTPYFFYVVSVPESSAVTVYHSVSLPNLTASVADTAHLNSLPLQRI